MSTAVAGPDDSVETLEALILAQCGMPLATDDVVALVLPLLAQVSLLHAEGRVADLNGSAVVVKEGGLGLRHAFGRTPRLALEAINGVQPAEISGLSIVGTLQVTHQDDGLLTRDTAVQADTTAPITQPVYLPGPASWEQVLGHHDELTDVFCLGMILASLACGLDFSEEDGLVRFAAARRNLFRLNVNLHPVVAATIVEMTELNRRERATDLAALAMRLRTWRDQPAALDVERALAGQSGVMPRRRAVLDHLRDRLFDLSRRNRLLYFQPGANSVNFTVASVPLVLQLASVRPEHICTWGGPFAEQIAAGKPVALQRWLRFDDQPYLSGALDHIISDTRRDRAEFGFSNLRLVLAFLRWHNLKEAPEERIVSPLLWLPVELSRRKGVRDQYVVQADGGEAEFNPVLRHHLQQLYGIELPEKVDLGKISLAQIHADILAQIARSEPAVELRLIDQAAIRLVRQKALQRMQQYRRRKAPARARTEGRLPAFSYDRADYRPLGRALYEQWVRPSELPQRFEAGAAPGGRRAPQMSEAATAEKPVGEEAGERLGFSLEASDGHRYAWDLDLTQVTLANFNYRKMSLVRDYAQLIEDPVDNPAFDRIFSIEPRDLQGAAPAPLPATEQWNVVAADATQNAAVSLARSKRSFIIQGPPGTGKSQTITNLIADYAARGCRVLFVCEKRAALDVVFHRLKQSGLESLCSLIHDSQTDKKAFIADLKTCYENWIASPHEASELQARRQALTQALDTNQALIDAFEQAMGREHAEAGASVRALLRRIVCLPQVAEIGAALRERLPQLAAWDAQRDLPVRLQRTLHERFGVDSLAAHPFARLGSALLADAHACGRAEALCERTELHLDTLTRHWDGGRGLARQETPLNEALAMAVDANWLGETGLAAHLDLLVAGSEALGGLQTLRGDLANCAEACSLAGQAASHWREKLTPLDTSSALALARELEPSLLRWLRPGWWRLRAELRRRYDFSSHAVHPGYVRVLEVLTAEHAAQAAREAAEATGRRQFGVSDLNHFLEAFATLQQRLPSDARLGRLIAHLSAAPDAGAAARAEASLQAALAALAGEVRENLAVDPSIGLGELEELLRDLRESLDDLPEMLPLLRAIDAGDAACADTLRRHALTPDRLDALVTGEALARLERSHPVLARFGGVALTQAARALAQHQQELFALNAEVIGATLHRRFGEHVRASMLATSQLDTEGRAFKKNYATGRRELEHEFSKSMRFRSIRDLCDDETGAVVNDLKPIWLMSPLSVSDTLPLAPDLFDVVIFDEASQIPTEEAVPALSRARQVIVVGDEMQLPPTSFFSASGSEEEDEIMVEEDGERIAINLDSDSLLNQAARNLPATLLAWHYRSRHEALISFSNAAFYAGRLVTIPDQTREEPCMDAEPVASEAEDAGNFAANSLLARPISFHRIADGVYSDRRNLPEAAYIAQTVREMLRRETGLSLGIVAFSEAQQGAIESALDALAVADEDFASRLEREYVREDQDQFNGLFVKNLENVQGDERDVIILSICYAPGPDGRMLMNFGPINQRGGEKRLNVIFSRARHHMAVISTIQAEAITNVHNDGAAALRAFLQFAQASASGRFERAQGVLGGLNQGARESFAREAPADAVRDALMEALCVRGHEVHVNVGRSQFRCDLAILAPDRRSYALAILLDDPRSQVVDTVERYVFRPGILRSFGWKVLDLPARDWLVDAPAVLARIEAMLESGEDRALDEETGLALVSPVSGVKDSAESPDSPEEASTIATAMGRTEDAGQYLVFRQGSSQKFWRVSQQGAELTIAYGHIGSGSRSQIKVFDTPERARREMDRLVGEKLRKGYIEEPSAAS